MSTNPLAQAKEQFIMDNIRRLADRQSAATFTDIETWALKTRNGFRQFVDSAGNFWIEQNCDKDGGWAKAVREGHKIAWEFDPSVGNMYTGRLLLDGEVMTKAEAAKKLWGFE